MATVQTSTGNVIANDAETVQRFLDAKFITKAQADKFLKPE